MATINPGLDTSGNNNNWAPVNINFYTSSSSTFDTMTDVPTNTSSTVANYCVLNPISKTSSTTISSGNLDVTTSSINQAAGGTVAVNSGKYYFEATVGTTTSGNTYFGIATIDFDETRYSGGAYVLYMSNGQKYTTSASAYGSSYVQGDILGCAVNCDTGTVTFYKNNVSQGDITGVSMTTPWKASLQTSVTITTAWNFNFGQRPFAYTPPTGFVALNTYNLPTPTIGATNTTLANSYMDATLYTGTSTYPRSVTNAAGFQPDLVWVKGRNTTYANILYDSVRGTGTSKSLCSNITSAEGNYSTFANLSSFNSNGFTVGSTSSTNILNDSSANFVAWQWKASGTTVSNTDGSITSTVSANTTSGFSVVTYTGNGSAGATVGHGLGVAPAMMIFKSRNAAANWDIYHQSLGNNKYLLLDSTAAAGTSAWLNNTSPSSTVFTLGNLSDTNTNGQTMVAYCFAEVAGYSKFGSYTGNGSSDGPFIYCGFKPAMIWTKPSSNIGAWNVLDNKRGPYNVNQPYLQQNSSNAEATVDYVDFLSNGFKIRYNGSTPNGSGQTIIYIAFAENPFKYANAR